MALRRFQPISRAAPWSAVLSWRDVRTRELQDLTGATLTVGLYQDSGCWRSDYGRPWGGWCGPWDGYGAPIFAARTQDDGSGPFVILPGNLQAQIVVPAGSLTRLHPGSVRLIAWATVAGVSEEIERETIPVLSGPTAMPVLPASVPLI